MSKTTISTILFLVGLNLGFTNPVKADSVCGWLLSKVSQASRIQRAEKQISDYKYGKSLVGYADGANLAILDLTAAQKAGLLQSLLEKFFERPVRLSGNGETIDSLIAAGGLKNGKLKSKEILNASIFLIQQFDSSEPRSGNFLERWIQSSFDSDVRTSIETGLFKDPEFRKYLEDMIGEPFFQPSKGVVLRTALNTAAVAQALIADTILVFLGFPPLAMPNLKFMEYSSSSQQYLTVAKDTSIRTATQLAVARLDFWGKVHVRYRSLRKIYLSSLFIFAGGYLAMNPSVLVVPFDMYVLGYKFHSTTSIEMQSYERSAYSPQAVVQEQLDAWLGSLDLPPSREEIEAKRALLEKQEKAGVFRIYD